MHHLMVSWVNRFTLGLHVGRVEIGRSLEADMIEPVFSEMVAFIGDFFCHFQGGVA
jgi:hypothetical protein